MAPGTYAVLSIDPLEVRFTVPTGWDRPTDAPDFVGPTSAAGGVSFWTVSNLYADPCAHVVHDPPVGSSVHDFATALADMAGTEAAAPTNVAISGFDGKFVAFTTPSASCDEFAPWRTPGSLILGADTEARVWVLDVDGTRLVILAHLWPDASAQGRAELEEVVGSIEIQP